jgi:secretion/DNA translocation related TadE-like protein
MTPKEARTQPVEAERGSGTVLVLLAAALLMTTLGVLIAAARVGLVQQRAAIAADAAALGAATRSGSDRDRCTAAGVAATANGARLTRCAPSDADVVVSVEARLPEGLRWLGHPVPASARAGPADRGTGGVGSDDRTDLSDRAAVP